MLRTMAILGILLLPVCLGGGCRGGGRSVAADTSLEGKWRAEFQQTWHCDTITPMPIEDFTFEIEQGPLLNRSVSSFSYQDANVTGAVAARIRLEKSHPTTVISGRLIGALVKPPNASVVTLQGYLVSQARYDAWANSKNRGLPPTDAGEVELELSGSALTGYALAGIVRSGDTCSPVNRLSPMVQDLTGHFGRGVPANWSAHVTLTKQ